MNRLLKCIALLAILIASIGVNISTAEASVFQKTRVVARGATGMQYQVLFRTDSAAFAPSLGNNICINHSDAGHSLKVARAVVISSAAEASWIEQVMVMTELHGVRGNRAIASSGSFINAGQDSILLNGNLAGANFTSVESIPSNFGALTQFYSWETYNFRNPMPERAWFVFSRANMIGSEVFRALPNNSNLVQAVVCSWSLN